MGVLAAPPLRDFFALSGPSLLVLGTALGGAAFSLAGLWLTDERFVPGRSWDDSPA